MSLFCRAHKRGQGEAIGAVAIFRSQPSPATARGGRKSQKGQWRWEQVAEVIGRWAMHVGDGRLEEGAAAPGKG
ncbi:hypothetical protein J1N35_012086 [Gossypium stocksii]|uniref:Uncharacterized protein n=1 Tax=Gossypium stocksii TaxID=47602 RepID=A0A9D3W5M9_9ROSI|nr:hypothetical protein J1N35_012086 [Gossypium stocksii]